jgi:phage terminase small subunit
MPVGRPPKPTAEKILNGNPGRRPLPEGEPRFAGSPEMPSWLDEDAGELWRSVVAELTHAGIGRKIDSTILAGMCRWYSLWRSFDQKLQGGDVEWKTICGAAATWKQFSAIACKFGLTPSDRTRIKADATPLQDDDPLTAILRRRAERG